MKIEKIAVDKLIPYARNAKKHDAAQVSKLAGSIKEFGFTNPVLIDTDNGIIAGHGRVMAAQKLELKEVPCIRLGHLTENQRKAYILADNRLAEIGGGWDEEMLKAELEALKQAGVDLTNTGFDIDDVLGESGDNVYTRKIESPKYEPKGECPKVSELFDRGKTDELVRLINAAKVPEEIKAFLVEAASRHTVFHFEKIAEYYAHATKDVQKLMEDSALIIIDFNDAIEKGFVRLSEGVRELYSEEHGEE
jgi:hypothetical protein